MTLLRIKQVLRNGPYAWPGGYPMFFITAEGAVLSFAAIREEWRNIVDAHLRNDWRSGWYIEGYDINWEDPDLFCDHTGTRIESAYAEPEDTDAA